MPIYTAVSVPITAPRPPVFVHRDLPYTTGKLADLNIIGFPWTQQVAYSTYISKKDAGLAESFSLDM